MEKDQPTSSCHRADVTQQRLVAFAVDVIRLASRLPKTVPARHIARQLVRSGTSPAPIYGEARGAESRKDFIHKLGVVLKELNETIVWLNILSGSGLLNTEELHRCTRECDELARIIVQSLKTAKSRSRQITNSD